MAEPFKIEIYRKKDCEDFTKALADPETRLETGGGAAMTAATAAALMERAGTGRQLGHIGLDPLKILFPVLNDLFDMISAVMLAADMLNPDAPAIVTGYIRHSEFSINNDVVFHDTGCKQFASKSPFPASGKVAFTCQHIIGYDLVPPVFRITENERL